MGVQPRAGGGLGVGTSLGCAIRERDREPPGPVSVLALGGGAAQRSVRYGTARRRYGRPVRYRTELRGYGTRTGLPRTAAAGFVVACEKQRADNKADMSQGARTAANGRHARPLYFTVLYSRVATNARSLCFRARRRECSWVLFRTRRVGLPLSAKPIMASIRTGRASASAGIRARRASALGGHPRGG